MWTELWQRLAVIVQIDALEQILDVWIIALCDWSDISMRRQSWASGTGLTVCCDESPSRLSHISTRHYPAERRSSSRDLVRSDGLGVFAAVGLVPLLHVEHAECIRAVFSYSSACTPDLDDVTVDMAPRRRFDNLSTRARRGRRCVRHVRGSCRDGAMQV